ncbi:hypothetical protein DXG01_008859 [Tephrocybe rancida]|nr:hypothetical protein DXG01_008859 [Tephrocybe rancida]
MFPKVALTALSFLAIVSAQLVDTLITKTHHKLPRCKYTKSDGYASQSAGAVTLDANWRWTHSTMDSTNCYTGQTWDKTSAQTAPPALPTAASMVRTTPASTVSPSAATPSPSSSSPRAPTPTSAPVSASLIVRTSTSSSSMFNVEVSNLPCGLTGALYFSEMDADGRFAEHSTNKAGANLSRCSDRYGTICDPDGCDSNPHRQDDKTFYGPGLKVDTTKKFTANGDVTEIRLLYVQNGAAIQNSKTIIPGLGSQVSVTGAYCDSQKTAFGNTKQFQAKGKAAKNGMALVLSVWDNYAINMLWLDSTYPTDASASTPGSDAAHARPPPVPPTDVKTNTPNSSATYSNIRFGEIGSTYTGGTTASTTASCATTSGTPTHDDFDSRSKTRVRREQNNLKPISPDDSGI